MALIMIIPAAVAVTLRLVPSLQEHTRVAMAASFISYGLLSWLAALVLAAVAVMRGRRSRPAKLITVIALAGLLLQASWLAPNWVRDSRPVDGDQLRVVSLNMLAGLADADQVVRQARHADLLVLAEITPDAEQALIRSGLDARLPYRIGESVPGTQGTMIWSRWPLQDTVRIPGTFRQWLTRARTPLGDVVVVGVHPCNPFCGADAWLRESQAVADAVRPHLAGPMIIAGDFNAVDDQWPMRRLYDVGLSSANDLAGTGWHPTYPSGQRFAGITMPPLIGIDHILVSGSMTATSFDTFAVADTDHHGVTARVGRVRTER
ncbi:endonuclease/exonuclease/phosphatase family protein [Propionibacteriaceae bacterium Y1700]|uniref:endonuclease/exonuclease/phosphatase family protein n=1 Tax=Microlunatus sp. Y1700 TaxID=3418487 RepID=UPI003DA6EC22